MPSIEEVVKQRTKKPFAKKEYRAWNLSGEHEIPLDSPKAASTPLSLESISDKSKIDTNNCVFSVSVDQIIRWKYKDRPENEFGNLEELAKTFKEIGQQQPCVVRTTKERDKYELIIGERRWRAAKIAQMPLLVVIRDVDDKTASLMQAVENEKRNSLSDYAKGMSYAQKIEQGLLKQKDLVDILGISKQQVSRLLSFNKLPSVLSNAIGDFRLVSARTAYEIARLSADESNIHALISIVDKIRDGKVGANSIQNILKKQQLKSSNEHSHSNKKITSTDGRHLFTWRLDNNSVPSIHFPKDIIDLINKNLIEFDAITNDIKKCLSNRLGNINKEDL